MRSIEAEIERTTQLAYSVGSEFITLRKYKDDREWWVLCHAIALLKRWNELVPEYACKTDPPEPDFITYDSSKELFKPIEIVEVMTPNRKRGDEHKESEKILTPSVKPIEKPKDPWSSFIISLNNKFLKFYQFNCWLIVYNNMVYEEISNSGFWHNILLANVKLWKEQNIVDFSKAQYERIFVLNAIAKALVCIHPDLSEIVPETNSNGFTIINY
ncbi:MAG: hypothetical protein ACM3O3_03575 [Syntrophothermus sp.]